MSRIGKNPVEIPQGVDVDIQGSALTAKGKLGVLSLTLVDEVSAKIDDGKVWMSPRDGSLRAHKFWGTMRSLVDNLITGVSKGFARNLEINGVGYRALMDGRDLVLQLGYSHEVRYPVPDGITIQCADQTHVSVRGADKRQVGQTAADIRAMRPPEPYKGKGIKYAEEHILRKEGKKK
jgi:large subunit ribosomal protein L6